MDRDSVVKCKRKKTKKRVECLRFHWFKNFETKDRQLNVERTKRKNGRKNNSNYSNLDPHVH